VAPMGYISALNGATPLRGPLGRGPGRWTWVMLSSGPR
jgi:hypothetical protein